MVSVIPWPSSESSASRGILSEPATPAHWLSPDRGSENSATVSAGIASPSSPGNHRGFFIGHAGERLRWGRAIRPLFFACFDLPMRQSVPLT